jgi:hypothetical protein
VQGPEEFAATNLIEKLIDLVIAAQDVTERLPVDRQCREGLFRYLDQLQPWQQTMFWTYLTILRDT